MAIDLIEGINGMEYKRSTLQLLNFDGSLAAIGVFRHLSHTIQLVDTFL
jgi:hypothetical protein